jgi:hypothetical protein
MHHDTMQVRSGTHTMFGRAVKHIGGEWGAFDTSGCNSIIPLPCFLTPPNAIYISLLHRKRGNSHEEGKCMGRNRVCGPSQAPHSLIMEGGRSIDNAG